MASAPIYTGTPKLGMTQISTANTARDGTGTLGTVLTAGASGSRLDRTWVVATGTTTAGVIRLFLYDGTNTRLLDEIMVTAITPSTSIKVWTGFVDHGGLLLPSNSWLLKASTHNAETFNVFTVYGDF